VGGVQPQTLTVNRQMNRYSVPRIIFINKLDRMGANPWTVIDAIRGKLGLSCAAVQAPIGSDEQLKGLVDLIGEKAYFFDGKNGEVIREEPVPENMKALVKEKRVELIESLSNLDKEMEEMYLNEQQPTIEQI
jgi:elongation factor G